MFRDNRTIRLFDCQVQGQGFFVKKALNVAQSNKLHKKMKYTLDISGLFVYNEDNVTVRGNARTARKFRERREIMA